MAASQTLRSLSGLSAEPPSLAEAALVMIDCQNTYREGVMLLHGVEGAIEEAQRVLARARAAGAPIMHIAHDAGPGSPYDTTADIGQIADPVAPADGEPTIIKKLPNAFVGTDLHDRLQATGRKNIIFTGFMTHMCVNSTVRGAFNLGYSACVVGRATATRSLPGAEGQVIDAETLHRASLAALSDLFATVVETADDLPD